MTVISDIDRMWPGALVDLGPIELADHYWGIVGTIPYEGHVVLAIIAGPPATERVPAMSMYLPNPDLRPTGFEPAEFIDMPPATWTDVTTAHRSLSDQTRSNITRWAHEYISGLVRNHQGGDEDVRSVIHDLHLQSTIADL